MCKPLSPFFHICLPRSLLLFIIITGLQECQRATESTRSAAAQLMIEELGRSLPLL